MANVERQLASVQRIDGKKPIEGADRIELVMIKGWQCIAKKDEFQVGDLCIYFEVDSFLPIEPEYEFLRKGCYKNVEGLGEGFRIRTIKMKGELSQGLAIPLDEGRFYLEGEPAIIGDDLTEELGVRKYEKPIPASLRGKAEGSFPSFIPKTDQERIQNCFEKIKSMDMGWAATLKLDGSSMTCFVKDGEVGVCSRNIHLKLEDNEGNAFVDAFNLHNLGSLLRDFHGATGRNIALQGELMGPGIQGNREGFSHLEYFIFDIWDIDEQRYLCPMERLVVKNLYFPSINFVPHWDSYHIRSGDTLEELLELADIPSLNHPIAEGIVLRSLCGKHSFKIINNKFLLKED